MYVWFHYVKKHSLVVDIHASILQLSPWPAITVRLVTKSVCPTIAMACWLALSHRKLAVGLDTDLGSSRWRFHRRSILPSMTFLPWTHSFLPKHPALYISLWGKTRLGKLTIYVGKPSEYLIYIPPSQIKFKLSWTWSNLIQVHHSLLHMKVCNSIPHFVKHYQIILTIV